MELIDDGTQFLSHVRGEAAGRSAAPAAAVAPPRRAVALPADRVTGMDSTVADGVYPPVSGRGGDASSTVAGRRLASLLKTCLGRSGDAAASTAAGKRLGWLIKKYLGRTGDAPAQPGIGLSAGSALSESAGARYADITLESDRPASAEEDTAPAPPILPVRGRRHRRRKPSASTATSGSMPPRFRPVYAAHSCNWRRGYARCTKPASCTAT